MPKRRSGVAQQEAVRPVVGWWWPLAAALLALAIGAVLVLAGKASPEQAAQFIGPVFVLLGGVSATQHRPGRRGEREGSVRGEED